ncbi:hypothetical protein ACWIGW_40870 [Nocardia brasiliensis]
MVDVLARADDNHQQHLGSAGPATVLASQVPAGWPAEYPNRTSNYSAFPSTGTNTDIAGLRHFWLRPINMSDRAKEIK